MKYKVIPTPEFIKNLKALKKRYKSIKKDILLLSEKLEENPKIGICLGNNIYKIRVKNSDNNKGKSAGYRIITYLIDEDLEIYLVTIYSKTDRENILDYELQDIISKIK